MCLWNPHIAIYLKRDYFIFAFTLRFFWSSTLFSPPVRAPPQPDFKTVHQQNIVYRKSPTRLRNSPTSKRSVHARFSINWSSVQVILTNRSSFISTWWGSEVCVFKFILSVIYINLSSLENSVSVNINTLVIIFTKAPKKYWQFISRFEIWSYFGCRVKWWIPSRTFPSAASSASRDLWQQLSYLLNLSSLFYLFI